MLCGPDTLLSAGWSAGERTESEVSPVRAGAQTRSWPHTVPFRDLLGVPFIEGGDDPRRGLDCWGQAAEIARRLGLRLPIPGREEDGLTMVGTRWEDADRVGDLIGSDPGKIGVATHVSTVVDINHHLVLSCSENSGPFVVPASMIGRVICVRRPAP